MGSIEVEEGNKAPNCFFLCARDGLRTGILQEQSLPFILVWTLVTKRDALLSRRCDSDCACVLASSCLQSLLLKELCAFSWLSFLPAFVFSPNNSSSKQLRRKVDWVKKMCMLANCRKLWATGSNCLKAHADTCSAVRGKLLGQQWEIHKSPSSCH